MLEKVSEAMAHAVSLYCYRTKASNPTVLFVVQPEERNVYDQRLLEFTLFTNHGLRVIRRTLTEVGACVTGSVAFLFEGRGGEGRGEHRSIALVYGL